MAGQAACWEKEAVVPGSEVAGFFVSVQQLSFIEQGCGWMMEKAREGRGDASAGRVETEPFALRAAFGHHEWPTLSYTICNSSQLRSVSTHSVSLNLNILIWKTESNLSALFSFL